MKRRESGRRWGLVGGVSVLVVAVGVVVATTWSWSRPRLIVGGGIVRSGQLTAGALARVIEGSGVKTVVNLRGRGGGTSWYLRERQVCLERGVEHHTVTFKVDERAPRFRVVQLVELLTRADRPILMHCRRGVDRTGLAAAVAVLVAGGTLAAAENELTPAGGHFCRREECAQHQFLDAYRRYLDRSPGEPPPAKGEVQGQSKPPQPGSRARSVAPGPVENSGFAEVGPVGTASVFTSWVMGQYCPEDYNALLTTSSDLPDTVVAGGSGSLEVRVHNRGTEAWVMSSGPNGVRLGVRAIGPLDLLPADAAAAFRDRRNVATDLARAGVVDDVVQPGDTRDFRLVFRAPTVTGKYLFQAEMVKEHEHWFGEMGWPGLVWEVLVTDDGTAGDRPVLSRP